MSSRRATLREPSLPGHQSGETPVLEHARQDHLDWEYDPVHHTDDVYTKLVKTDSSAPDPVEPFAEVRRRIDGMKKTRGTFAFRQVTDGVDGTRALRAYVRTYMEFAGAWPMPEGMTGGIDAATRTAWINPHYKDRHLYSDCYVYCSCGAQMYAMRSNEEFQVANEDDEHAPDCLLYQRYHAKARLAKKRCDIIDRMLKYGHAGRKAHARLGVSNGTITGHADRLGIDLGGTKRYARQVRANTAACLLYTHDRHTLGDVFGIHPDSVVRDVRERTPVDPVAVRKYREENQ